MGYRVTGVAQSGVQSNCWGTEYRVHCGYSTRSEGGRFDTVTDGNITRHEGEKSHGEARRIIGNTAD